MNWIAEILKELLSYLMQKLLDFFLPTRLLEYILLSPVLLVIAIAPETRDFFIYFLS